MEQALTLLGQLLRLLHSQVASVGQCAVHHGNDCGALLWAEVQKHVLAYDQAQFLTDGPQSEQVMPGAKDTARLISASMT